MEKATTQFLKDLLARANYEKHIRDWLKGLYSYWESRPIAKSWCKIVESSGILDIA